MNILVAEKLRKSYGDKTLFENVSFGINDGDKIGLIGVNGTGKSTLLKLIAGIEEQDEGSIIMRNGLRMAYLSQLPEFDNSLSVLDNVIKDKKANSDYRNVSGEAFAMLQRLGIENPLVCPDVLSGGQRKRASLVRTLLTESDLLILDEPTNHLDSEMTEWLEDTLKKYKGAFLCVTHDRYFLDEVTNKILELDRRSLYCYMANYSKFIELKSEREDIEQASERKNKTLFKTELAWMLRGARARSTKQKAHIQRFEQLRDRSKLEDVPQVEIRSAYSRLGKKTIEVEHLCKSYGEKLLFCDFSYIFLQNDRIGIIGPNGCGKSTLIKILKGEVTPDRGSIEYGATVKYGYFAQECELMEPDMKVLDYIKETAESIETKDGIITASKMCERFLFDSRMQYSIIGKLSGGEKRRLYLLKILMSAPNILILDEPTNDLDIQTLTILEEYLQSFQGIVIAVSHDRYFLDKTVRRMFVFTGNGNIQQLEGNYTDYRERLLTEAEEENSKKESIIKKSINKGNVNQNGSNKENLKRKHEKKIKFTYAEQKEFDSIDKDIEVLEKAIEELKLEIDRSSSDYSILRELISQKDEKEAELEYKMERWMYLNELNDKITGKIK